MMTNCPKCSSESIKRVKWTWWGGVLGPALINSTKCESCGHTFNGNTGKSNTTAIVVYSIVLIVIAFVVSMLIGIAS